MAVEKKSNKKEPKIDSWLNQLKNIDRRIPIFLIFIAISAFLWLMNALSKDYITEIDCPVEFYNIPDNYVMIGEIPAEVQLQVSGRGFTLLKYTLGSIALPFNLDLQSYFSGNQEDQENVHFQYYLSSKKEQFERFLNDEIKVLDVRPSTLRLHFDKLHKKKIGIKPATNFSWAPQYRQKGNLLTTPDSVIVNGPKTKLDTLDYIKTELIIDEQIKKNKSYTADLIAPEQCNLMRKKVRIDLRTEQFTENTIQVPISITNKPDSINLTIFPNKINITYLVSFEDYEIIDASDFQAAINYKEIEKQNEPQELNINLLFVPEEAKILRYWPQKARFIINEK
ncbi:MAG TPA: hypothetical protein VJ937_10200 [Salinivirga sp.]|uniref:CdaR family protein n=1 Tax=Salinivirga sp. TaxID=1970192 RepID=UPI002B481EFF|nr:hypothetical protein [Salinivirga sp.]HKK59841.1 hypothetical protein [Salinivirga sp.]